MRSLSVKVNTSSRVIKQRVAGSCSGRFHRAALAGCLCLLPTTLLAGSHPFFLAATASIATSTTKMNEKTNSKEDIDDDPWARVGGGAINEKKRRIPASPDGATTSTALSPPENKEKDTKDTKDTTASGFNPTKHKAHLFHALEGLDRYPNYLSRWNNVQDMDRLEQALQDRLAQVQQQRHGILERRAQIQALVQELVDAQSSKDDQELDLELLLHGPTSWQQVREKVLDARTSQAIFGSQMFSPHARSPPPTLTQVLSGHTAVELDAGRLEMVMDEEMLDVYSIPLLSPDFCAKVRHYTQALTALAQERAPELKIGLRPIDLDTVGLPWINDLLFHLIVQPISRHLFLKTECWQDLDWRQGYVAAYSARPSTEKPRQRLVTHTDDSEVTLNVCLGEPDFCGGHVEFRNLRGATADAAEVLGTVERPNVGTALLHAGRHFHTVTPVTSGNRFALILWARSWQGVRAQQCPCCWLNRRPGSVQEEGNDCVCGKRWN